VLGKEIVHSSGQEILMRPSGIPVIALLLGFFCARPAVAEEQLPINQLDACEIVLHELIADLTRIQTNSRHESINSRGEDPGLYIVASSHRRSFCPGNQARKGKIWPLSLNHAPTQVGREALSYDSLAQ
jgi:hypothetical protein